MPIDQRRPRNAGFTLDLRFFSPSIFPSCKVFYNQNAAPHRYRHFVGSPQIRTRSGGTPQTRIQSSYRSTPIPTPFTVLRTFTFIFSAASPFHYGNWTELISSWSYSSFWGYKSNVINTSISLFAHKLRVVHGLFILLSFFSPSMLHILNIFGDIWKTYLRIALSISGLRACILHT